jgi:DNA-binding transcriptional ArsR family regulator
MSQRAQSDAVWKALADPRRRAILDFLADGPRTTGAIVDRFDTLCRTAVMKHMDVLERAGLLLVRREGRERWNYLNPVPIQRVCDRWIRRHIQHRASSLSRLKDVVEAGAQKDEETS